MRLYVDWRSSASLMGRVLGLLAIPLAFPLLMAVYYREPLMPFMIPILVTTGLGIICRRLTREPDLGRARRC